MDFKTAFNRLIGIEAGFTKDPRDPGNWTGGRPGVGELKGTKFGLSAATYPDLDIENLTLDQAQAIYLRDWWQKLQAGSVDPAIVYQVWVFAINAGMETAKRALQRAACVVDDGQIGDHTITAIQAMPVASVICRFNAQVLRYYTSCKIWNVEGKGWVNRVADQLEYEAEDVTV
jgi:lysozyme family protein